MKGEPSKVVGAFQSEGGTFQSRDKPFRMKEESSKVVGAFQSEGGTF